MFLIEACRNYRLTEPVWFRFFRGFFAVALTIMILIYSDVKIKKLGGDHLDDFVIVSRALLSGKKK